MRDMKNLKIGFCRGEFVLFDDMLEYTVLGYKKGSKSFEVTEDPPKMEVFMRRQKPRGIFGIWCLET